MTAAVPLIDAATVAVVTGIMGKQTGESEGSPGRERWEKGVEMDGRPRTSSICENWRGGIQEI